MVYPSWIIIDLVILFSMVLLFRENFFILFFSFDVYFIRMTIFKYYEHSHSKNKLQFIEKLDLEIYKYANNIN